MVLDDTDDNRPRFIWFERWNAPLYALCVMIGVPLMGWLLDDAWTKVLIAFAWVAIAPVLFTLFEFREIIGQMEGRGTLDERQVRNQLLTGLLPVVGALVAVFVWAYASAAYPHAIRYGWVEWVLVGHTLVVISSIAAYVYSTAINFLKSTPRAERAERRLP